MLPFDNQPSKPYIPISGAVLLFVVLQRKGVRVEDARPLLDSLEKVPGAILLVDGESPCRGDIIDCLGLAGFRVSELSTRDILNERTSAGNPDLILCDLKTGDSEGLKTATRIQSHDSFRGIPLIALCSGLSPAETAAVFDCGFADIISKPIIREEAIARIKTQLSLRALSGRRRAEKELFNSRQMLRSILDTIPQRVFWKDRNLVYVGCNKPLAIDCGYNDPGELVGKTDYETASAQTADAFRADDRLVMESGVPKLNYEERQIKPDGQYGLAYDQQGTTSATRTDVWWVSWERITT
jgi:CheY-like chemotaxis protein